MALILVFIMLACSVPLVTAFSFKKAFGASALAISLSTAVPSLAISEATKLPIVGSETIMAKKTHGTSDSPVQSNLRYNVDNNLADKITNYNRRFAEFSGYFRTTSWLQDVNKNEVTTYYDSVTGKPLFEAPIGRSFDEFVAESNVHGWPSFRDQEVVWDNVRALSDGEMVSLSGTHLGHNLPDKAGNRYCINLVSVAGNPSTMSSLTSSN